VDSQQLVDRATAGDELALDELLERHLPALRAFVRLRCGPALRARESVSDIVQSVCREVLGELDRFEWRGEAGFRAWLYLASARKIADRAEHWRAGKRDAAREVPLERSGAASDAPLLEVYRTVCTPSAAAAGRELMERIELAFEQLGEDDREVIALARIAGLSHAEIGERLGCSEVAARKRLFRALALLSDALGRGAG